MRCWPAAEVLNSLDKHPAVHNHTQPAWPLSSTPPHPTWLTHRHNGVYVQTKGLMEQDLMDTLLSYLTRQEQDGEPFMAYYAPHAIHQ